VITQFKPSRQFQLEFPPGHAETDIRNASFALSRCLDWMKYQETAENSLKQLKQKRAAVFPAALFRII